MKTFVFRSKVSTSSPFSPLKFGEDNEIVIPMAVYEKLNSSFIPQERRRNASGLLNYIDSLTEGKEEKVKMLHDPKKGLVQANGSKLFILSPEHYYRDNIMFDNSLTKYDKMIFQLCLELQDIGKDVHLISRNPVIREKALLLGIQAEQFRDELAPSLKEQYTGKGGKILTSLTSYIALEQKECDGGIPLESLIEAPAVDPVENMFYVLSTPEKELTNEHIIVRYSKGRLFPLTHYRDFCPEGYRAMNDEQKMMMECLLAPADIAPLVIIKGAAGSGKTYGAISAALENIDRYNDGNNRNIGHYREFLVSAPVVEMVPDQKMGYLPGDLVEKFSPYVRGFQDNIKNLLRNTSPDLDNSNISDIVEELFEREYIEFEPANYLRGSSIANAFFMLDEAQNYSPDTMPHIVTRAGNNCKIVLMGDPSQVSALDLNERLNGLVYASESMKGSPLTWQVALSKSVRSPLANEALFRMKY